MTNGFKLQFDDGLSDSGLFFFMTWRNERLICNCIVLQTISQLFLWCSALLGFNRYTEKSEAFNPHLVHNSSLRSLFHAFPASKKHSRTWASSVLLLATVVNEETFRIVTPGCPRNWARGTPMSHKLYILLVGSSPIVYYINCPQRPRWHCCYMTILGDRKKKSLFIQ